MKLTKIILSVIVLIALNSCGSNTDKKNDKTTEKTQTQKKEIVKITPDDLLGSWCETPGLSVYFNLYFYKESENSELSASYSSGGPFEILFKIELRDQEALLYFLGAPGSIAFSQAFEGQDFDKEAPMAICSKPVGNKMEIEVKQTLPNIFATMGKHTLTKLGEDEFCGKF